MTWLLIIVVANGWGGVNDPKMTFVTEAQCRASIEAMRPLRPNVGAECVGPNGERITWDGDK